MNRDERIVYNLLDEMLAADCEIVSYGLPPNPNGFCFESHGDVSEAVKRKFSRRLDALTKNQEEILKRWIF